MSFIPAREKIFREKIGLVQEEREIKLKNKQRRAKTKESLKSNMNKTLDNIRKLEGSLRQIHFIREQKKNIRFEIGQTKRYLEFLEISLGLSLFYNFLALKDKIKQITLKQDKKIIQSKILRLDLNFPGQSPINSGSSSPKSNNLHHHTSFKSSLSKNLNFF